MLTYRKLAFSASILLLGAAPIFAHHQFSSEFDKNKPMTVSGTIAKVDWTDPHAMLYVDVKNSAGKNEEWKFEMASPNYFKAHNIAHDSLKKGETVTINAYAATAESHVGSARMVEMKGGHSMEVADPSEDGGPAK